MGNDFRSLSRCLTRTVVSQRKRRNLISSPLLGNLNLYHCTRKAKGLNRIRLPNKSSFTEISKVSHILSSPTTPHNLNLKSCIIHDSQKSSKFPIFSRFSFLFSQYLYCGNEEVVSQKYIIASQIFCVRQLAGGGSKNEAG